LPSGKITLTFDNGPESEVTPLVLDCLARHGVRTTFFVMGRKADSDQGRALVRRAMDEGHWIGNHTYSHAAALGRVSPEVALREFERAEQILSWIEQPRRLFRPPGSGKLGPHLLQPVIVDKLVAGSYTCVLWNSVPGDYRDPEGWLARAVADVRTRRWTLMALHDLPNGAMAHLEMFLSGLKNEGFELVQDFPPECVPIMDGKIVLPLEPYVRAVG
jgi:peptidoglycan/xylan/chitin deacetylase (PgdA/CDA1 family)